MDEKIINMTRLTGLDHGVSTNHFSKQDFFSIFILLALCLTLFFFRLGDRPIWDIDEGMHATTSREMVTSGEWIVTTFNGEPFYDKPAFYNWLVAISFLIFGFTEFAARLPAAIIGSACVFVTFQLGRRMFNPLTGCLSAVVLATSIEFWVLSRTIVHDISLAFFISLALGLFYSGFKAVKGRKIRFFLFYVALGFAVLSKGPIGVLLPAIIIVMFLILKGKLGFIREMMIGWGVLIFLVVAAPWYTSIALKDPEFASYFFIQKNLMTFFSEASRHPEPFYFYLPILLLGFFPWSWLLPYAVIRPLRWRPGEIADGALFSILWFGAMLLFFCVSRSKLPTYILPLFPAMALLVGFLCHELLKTPSQRLRKGFLYSYLPIMIICAMALIYSLIRPPLKWEAESGIDMNKLTMVLLWITGVFFAGFFLFLNKYYKAFFSAIVIMAVGAMLFAILVIIPNVNPYRSTRAAALKLDQILAEGEKIVFYHRLQNSALFYTGRKGIVLDTPEALQNYLGSEKKMFCIIQQKRLQRLKIKPRVFYRQGDRFIITN